MTLDLWALKRRLGGRVWDGGRRWLGPGPGHSRRDASLSVRLAPDGRPLIHSFAGDPLAACAEHLGLAQAGEDRSAERERERKRAAETQAFVLKTWAAAGPIKGTIAETYLWRRGVLLEGAADLRFHACAPRARQPRKPGEPVPAAGPALLALVRDGEGRPCALHATFLKPDGSGKAFGDRSRLMFGPTAGGAVRLEPVGGDGVLAVGEGIETTMGFAGLKGVPAWAALSTSGLKAFTPPTGVRKLLIAADNDDGGAGMAAALDLAERASRRCAVAVHPAPEGRDWADVAEEAANG